ncbi:phage head closure protein [Endozoicomonas sp. ISHI1]|uniref:phage head closure protein n=1 Tax=Endozoicomonas sp. ISHI1 TaxID=2825882 RepID=UPI00214864FE|nr:phage head closure protein [Endozoicomonas sp. ISHI1]
MRAGVLRHSVRFQKPVDTSDGFTDNASTSWENATKSPTRAEIKPVSAKEIEAAAGKIVSTDLTVNIRFNKTLAQMDNQWRMVHREITYEVLAAYDPDMRRRQLKVHCRRLVI